MLVSYYTPERATEPAPKLSPGLYRLSRTVRNPHPDRRYKHDWRALTEWPAGGEYYVDTEGRIGQWRGAAGKGYDEMWSHHEGYATIAVALEPLADRVGDMIGRHVYSGASPELALALLIERGLLSREEVSAAMRHLEEMPEEEWQALRDRNGL